MKNSSTLASAVSDFGPPGPRTAGLRWLAPVLAEQARMFCAAVAEGIWGQTGPALEGTAKAPHAGKAQLVGDLFHRQLRRTDPGFRAVSTRFLEQLLIRGTDLLQAAPQRARARAKRARDFIQARLGALARAQLATHVGEQAVDRRQA